MARERGRIALTWASVLLIMYVVPLFFYGPASALGWVEMPEPEAPGRFMLAVLLTKASLAVGFVGLFHLGRGVFAPHWPAYAGVWWIMFALGEAGSALAGDYGWAEAGVGVASEAVYVPAAAYVSTRIMGGTPRGGETS